MSPVRLHLRKFSDLPTCHVTSLCVVDTINYHLKICCVYRCWNPPHRASLKFWCKQIKWIVQVPYAMYCRYCAPERYNSQGSRNSSTRPSRLKSWWGTEIINSTIGKRAMGIPQEVSTLLGFQKWESWFGLIGFLVPWSGPNWCVLKMIHVSYGKQRARL